MVKLDFHYEDDGLVARMTSPGVQIQRVRLDSDFTKEIEHTIGPSTTGLYTVFGYVLKGDDIDGAIKSFLDATSGAWAGATQDEWVRATALRGMQDYVQGSRGERSFTAPGFSPGSRNASI